MINISNEQNSKSAGKYRLKLSTVALAVFLAAALLLFYLKTENVIGDMAYLAGLIGLVISALIATFTFGRIAHKRYPS